MIFCDGAGTIQEVGVGEFLRTVGGLITAGAILTIVIVAFV